MRVIQFDLAARSEFFVAKQLWIDQTQDYIGIANGQLSVDS
jgi:hypothetical protein